jgi:hypothetical protein
MGGKEITKHFAYFEYLVQYAIRPDGQSLAAE